MGRLRGSDEGLRHDEARYGHLPIAQPRLSARNFFCSSVCVSVRACVDSPASGLARTHAQTETEIHTLKSFWPGVAEGDSR